MSYVQSNLLPGERIVYLGKVHWYMFVPGIAFLIIGIVMANLIGPDDGLGFIAGLVLLGAIFSLVRATIVRLSTELAVTSSRIVAKTGFIRRHPVELLHSKVESVTVDQDIMGRVLGFGTVVVRGTGGGRTPIPHISEPLKFRRQTMDVVEHETLDQAT